MGWTIELTEEVLQFLEGQHADDIVQSPDDIDALETVVPQYTEADIDSVANTLMNETLQVHSPEAIASGLYSKAISGFMTCCFYAEVTTVLQRQCKELARAVINRCQEDFHRLLQATASDSFGDEDPFIENLTFIGHLYLKNVVPSKAIKTIFIDLLGDLGESPCSQQRIVASCNFLLLVFPGLVKRPSLGAITSRLKELGVPFEHFSPERPMSVHDVREAFQSWERDR